MKKSHIASLIAVIAAMGCSVPIPITQAIPIFKIQGGLLAGGFLPISNFDLPIQSGSQKLPPGTKKIRLTAVALRSVLSAATDRTDDALKNSSLIGQCPDGRAHLGFIDEVTVMIKHQGAADSTAVLLGHYQKAKEADPCGIDLQTSDVNIKDYAADYELKTSVSGKTPNADVEMGGFIELTDDVGV